MSTGPRIKAWVARDVAADLLSRLTHAVVSRVDIAGSLRRGEDEVNYE